MRVRIFILIVCLLAVVGCGKSDPYGREPLTGTITFGGLPLDEGSIQFWSTEPGAAWRSGAMIVDGKYQVPREQGLPPGTYRVVISSPGPDESGPRLTPEQLFRFSRDKRLSSGLAQERLPTEYNSASHLEIEVRPGAENHFDFIIP
jgi:hypothetical protein